MRGVLGAKMNSSLTQSLQQIDPFAPVLAVLQPPLVEEDIEVAWVFKEAKVAGGSGGGKDSLKVSFATQLVFGLRQDAYVLRGQHVQDRREEVLVCKALAQVEGPFNLLISRQIRSGSLPRPSTQTKQTHSPV